MGYIVFGEYVPYLMTDKCGKHAVGNADFHVFGSVCDMDRFVHTSNIVTFACEEYVPET